MSEHSLKQNGSRTSSRKNSQTSKCSSFSQKSTNSIRPAVESEKKLSFLGRHPETKPTLSDYKNKRLGEKPLFPTEVTLDSNDDLLERKIDNSFLVTGFGMRNMKSLQDALRVEEEKRLLQLYKKQQKQLEEEERLRAAEAKPRSTSSLTSSSSSMGCSRIVKLSTDSETSTTDTTISDRNQHLDYLMGLQTVAEEDTIFTQPKEEPEEEVFIYSTSAPMRNAQKYLRVHRIFDFFQFIIAHLLGSSPENPISFILELLNKCLLYRSGMGEPPLLYDKRHITQLFYLMDRMGSGFVDMEQYKKGMGTLGICEYNSHPLRTEDGLVDKEIFIREVYEAELALFQDLIGRKWMKKMPRKIKEDQVAYHDVSMADSVPYFIPPELFKSYKKEKFVEIKEEEEEEFYGD